jgi:hypothetical protein
LAPEAGVEGRVAPRGVKGPGKHDSRRRSSTRRRRRRRRRRRSSPTRSMCRHRLRRVVGARRGRRRMTR